jgi:hypothetical protein
VDSVASIPANVLTRLRSLPGVTGLAMVRTRAEPVEDPGRHVTLNFGDGVVTCAELATTPGLGRCPPGAQVVAASPFFGGRDSTTVSTVWPRSGLSPGDLAALPVQTIAVSTNSSAAIEAARTILEHAFPWSFFPTTISEQIAESTANRLNAQYQQLADVVILTSLPIAGCSLAVSVAAGLGDRKRPFSLLRLTGAPIGMLRRVVALESAAPLLAIAVLSIGAGFASSALFLRSQLHETLHPPGVSYYFIVLGGVAASLLAIASTLPLLERMTGPEAARND